MRRTLLTAVMLLMGMTMVAGSARALFGNALLPLDQELGTHSSAAAAVLGIGLMAAAINPRANISWVRAGILYGVVTIAFEVGAYFWLGAEFFIGPIIFGVACSLLLIALYPTPGTLMPPVTDQPKKTPSPIAPAATPKTPV
ncbi:MAG TPA: hypothetical protein VGU71_02275 [Candidatus Dormibacteraeota bacterium]|nr:hypothetical protein [Candidatus Dormibacteraeota bacterium]